MKSKLTSFFSTCFFLCIANLSMAQWVGTNPVHFAGNVGIGTTTPSVWFGAQVLEIQSARPVLKLATNTAMSTITFTHTGVNATTHNGEFHLNYAYNPTTTSLSEMVFGTYPGGTAFGIRADGHIAIQDNKQFRFRTLLNSEVAIGFDVSSATLRVSNTRDGINRYITLGGYNAGATVWTPQFILNTKTGNVGIGTTVDPSEKLTVAGTIYSREVKVEATAGADFVFDNDYNLPTLEQVARYIQDHKHLPGIASAEEMKKDGIELGEMNIKLLQKLEELTLYMIEFRKEMDQLKKENEDLRKRK